MAQYDFFIAGRWRNNGAIKEVLDLVRASGKTAYCFIDNAYVDEKVEFHAEQDAEAAMQKWEALSLDDPQVRKVFEIDMAGERAADAFLLVLPAGTAAHIEAGVAYGMGKKCYAVGEVEKTESLYCIFDKIFPNNAALEAWLKEQKHG